LCSVVVKVKVTVSLLCVCAFAPEMTVLGRTLSPIYSLTLVPVKGRGCSLILKHIIWLNTRHNIKINCFKPYSYLVDVSATAVTFIEYESTHIRKRQQQLPKRQPNNYKV